MKKTISVILCVVLLFAALPTGMLPVSAATVSGSCGTKLTWTLNTETGILTVNGTGEMTNWYSSSSNIPWYSYRSSIKTVTVGDGVTSIGIYAFSGCSGLTSITIPDSVTSIGNHAFSDCGGLTSVTIGDSVTSIGGWAFYGCGGLTSVTIGDSVTSIGNYAFYKCSGLTSVTIPDGVTSIGGNAFQGCSGLTSVTIGDSVTSIGGNAFSGCSGLKSITIPDGVTSIGSGAFYDTAWYNNQPGGLVYAGKVVYTYKGTCPSSVNIKEGTLGIADGAFRDCSRLTSITIPDSVTSIGSFAFCYCSGLTSITIPDGVTSIGEGAFLGCSGLKSVTIGDGVTSIGSAAFYDTAWYNNQPGGLVYAGKVAYKYKGTCPSSVNIKEGTLGIAGVAFSYCSGLTSITIPDSVTSIGDLAFFFCDALTTVNYEGDKSDRKKIAIDGSNDALLNATWHYNACIHDFALLKRVAKTCAADGYDLCRCTKCGVVAQQNIIPAGHDYEETVVAPTCTEDGYTLYQCVDCSAAYKDQYVPAHHDYVVTTVVAPTCTEGGYTLYRCVSCGDGYQGDFTEKLPHDYRQTIRAATCTEDGYKEYTCAGCGDCYKKPSGVAATGHYVFDGACVICGMAEETIHHIEEKTAEMMPYLQTAVQLKQHGDSCDLRFVSMVDSDLPDYESVGFIMEIMGYEQKISTPTVYTSFLDETAGKVTAAQYGADYFILTTANIGSDLYGEKITVRPYIELVGGGIIKGNALEFVLNDYIGG